MNKRAGYAERIRVLESEFNQMKHLLSQLLDEHKRMQEAINGNAKVLQAIVDAIEQQQGQ